MKNKFIIVALVLVVAGAAVAGNNRVFAKNTENGPNSILVQILSDKFNLNKNDVQAVFDQYKTNRQQDMQNKYDESLSQAVKDGKITEAQKQLILAKHQELQSQRKTDFESKKNMTPDERKNAMQVQKQALEDWAKQNNIDIKYLMGGRMGHFGEMKGGWVNK